MREISGHSCCSAHSTSGVLCTARYASNVAKLLPMGLRWCNEKALERSSGVLGGKKVALEQVKSRLCSKWRFVTALLVTGL
jgi:hypothetical protein